MRTQPQSLLSWLLTLVGASRTQRFRGLGRPAMRVITHGWEALKPMAWMMKYAPMAHIRSPEEFLSIDNRPEGSPVSLSPAQNQRALSLSANPHAQSW